MSELADNEDEEGRENPLATVLSGGILVSIGKFLSIGFGFLTQVTMARLLTEAGYGQVVLAISVVSIGGLIATLGLDDGVMRELPHREDNSAEARGVVRSSLVIALVSGIAVGTIVFATAPVLAARIFESRSLTQLLRIGAISIPFSVVGSVAVGLVRGAHDARPHAYVNQVIQPAARFLFIAALVISGFGAVGAVAGQVSAIILGSLLILLLAWRSLPQSSSEPESMYRPVLAFSLPLIIFQGIGFINSNIDIYIIGYFLESSTLGVYNIALQLGNIVMAIFGTAGFLLPPMVTRLYEDGNLVEMRRTYQIVTKWTALLLLPAFAILFFAPGTVIKIAFGKNYIGGSIALQFLLLGYLFAVLTGLHTQVLVSLGENRIISYFVFIEVIINVSGNFILVPTYGIEGAAIAFSGSTIIGESIAIVYLYRNYGVHPFTRAEFAPVASIGAIALLGYGALRLAGLPTSAVILLIGVAYLPVVLSLAPEPEDSELLARIEDQTGYDISIIRRAARAVRWTWE